MRLVPRFACIAALVLAVPAIAGEERVEEPKIYTCTDPDGTVVYQDEPCAPPKPVVAPKAAPAAAPKPAKTKASTKTATKTKTKTWMLDPGARASKAPPRLKNVPWEPTWRAFVEAMRAEDRSAILRCLSSRAQAEWTSTIESAAPGALREMVAPYERVVVEGDVGPYWSIRVHRAKARPKWVFFERAAGGEWKIAAL